MKTFWSAVKLLGLALGLLVATPAIAFAERGDCSNLNEAQFQSMADEVLARVLNDQAFNQITSGTQQPAMVIGDLDNDSHSYRLETDTMFNALRNALINSHRVRLLARGADFADFILAAQLTSTLVRDNGGRSVASYRLNITLTKPNGEYLGAWSAERGC